MEQVLNDNSEDIVEDKNETVRTPNPDSDEAVANRAEGEDLATQTINAVSDRWKDYENFEDSGRTALWRVLGCIYERAALIEADAEAKAVLVHRMTESAKAAKLSKWTADHKSAEWLLIDRCYGLDSKKKERKSSRRHLFNVAREAGIAPSEDAFVKWVEASKGIEAIVRKVPNPGSRKRSSVQGTTTRTEPTTSVSPPPTSVEIPEAAARLIEQGKKEEITLRCPSTLKLQGGVTVALLRDVSVDSDGDERTFETVFFDDPEIIGKALNALLDNPLE